MISVPTIGSLTCPPCVCAASSRLTRAGTSGKMSGLCVINTTGSSVVTCAERPGDVRLARPKVRDPAQPDRSYTYSLVLEHRDSSIRQRLAHAFAVIPPVVIAQHREHAQRRMQLLQFCRGQLRLDETARTPCRSVRRSRNRPAAQPAPDSPHWSSPRWSAACRAPHAAIRCADRSTPRFAGRISILEAPFGGGGPPASRARSRKPTPPSEKALPTARSRQS